MNHSPTTRAFDPAPNEKVTDDTVPRNASRTAADSLGATLARLNIGEETMLEPEWLRPFEHWAGHIPFAFWIISALRPRSLVELGTHRGNSYLAFCQAIETLHVDTRAYAVDTWQGDEHMALEHGIFEELSAYHMPKYGHFSSLVRSSFDEARSLFSDGSVDLLHIDGTHTYEEVLNDFETWKSALSDRAVVLMHDVNVRRDQFGVWKVWEELAAKYPHFEFFHSYGLGVLGVGENLPEPLRALFSMAGERGAASHVRSYFATRGRSVITTLLAQMERTRKDEEILQIARELDSSRHYAAAAASQHEAKGQEFAAERAQKDAQIERQNAEINRQSLEIAEQSAKLSSFDAQLTALNAKLHDWDNETLAAREVEQQASRQRFNSASAQIAQLRDDITRLTNAKQNLESSLREIWASTSWKVTRPLRGMGRMIPSLRLTSRPHRSPPVSAPAVAAVAAAPAVTPRKEDTLTLTPVQLPDLFDLRTSKPTSKIAVVMHVYYPELCDELLDAVEQIDQPFDLFVTLVQDFSDHKRDDILRRIPKAKIWSFPNRGRDILPFMSLVNTGALFAYDLICKLHTKRSPHRSDGDAWRRHLIAGVLPSEAGIRTIIDRFAEYPDLGLVVADGQIFAGADVWTGNSRHLCNLLPLLSLDVERASTLSLAGGSVFWIRPWVLRDLVGLQLDPAAYEPEPVLTDGSLAHAVERLFSVACHSAGLQIEQSSVVQAGNLALPKTRAEKPRVVAFYLPQFHPTPENNEWWGEGFTEWTNVTKASPLFEGHRQPRLPGELGFTDLRVAETRKRQTDLAREYGVSAFCYYYYWFDDGRRLLHRPLDEVLASGEPDFPFMICWANEPWSRNWDGLNKEVLVPQTYTPGWVEQFAASIAPILKDPRYVRIDKKPALFIYRVMSIPDPLAAMETLRKSLAALGVPQVHIAAARVAFPEDAPLPVDPALIGLDAFFEFPPHGIPTVQMPRSEWPEGLTGGLYDYGKTVDAALAKLDESTDSIPVHYGAMMGWDNTARRGNAAHVFYGATPTNFRRYLRGVVNHWGKQPMATDHLVLVNAWNEWAEGTCLEPDRDFGRGWLEAVRSALGK